MRMGWLGSVRECRGKKQGTDDQISHDVMLGRNLKMEDFIDALVRYCSTNRLPGKFRLFQKSSSRHNNQLTLTSKCYSGT